jgi:signal peptidase I
MPQSSASTVSARGRSLLSVKDTIESVVVAFILAFVFRAFVAEAFVIPTGSMAPNLYGMHRMHTCSVCGTEYAYGFSELQDHRLHPPPELICPNCEQWGEKQLPGEPQNGDRIFVLKWLFDVGRMLPALDPHGLREWWHVFKPRRWDVVVFKDPNDGTTNFIKRLIGLPGEVLEIIDGDIYTATASDLSQSAEGKSILEKLGHQPVATYAELSPKEQRTLNGALKIQRKTERAQSVLWLPAYDNDFLPVLKPDLAGWRPVGPAGDWQTNQRKLRFKPTRRGRYQEVAFFRCEADRTEEGEALSSPTVTDVYAYNGYRSASAMGGFGTLDQIVSDVRLRCVLVPGGEQGRMTLSLSKRDDLFVAAFTDQGEVRLTRSSLSRPERPAVPIGEARITPFRRGKPVRLALTNVDYRVTLWVEGKPLIQTTDEQYPVLGDGRPETLAAYARGLQPNGKDADPHIRIGAADMSLELWHVVIERDVYYRSFPEASRNIGWGTQGRPIYLRDIPARNIEEYFCLGDNSPLSKDSRLWNTIGPHLVERLERGDYQYGTVPGDQMVGRAFFVYWPAGLPLIQDRLPLIPNVGDMRLIR